MTLPAGIPVPGEDRLEALWALLRRAREAGSDRELGFILVNDTLSLAPYRQAALCLVGEGAYSLSGVVQIEANAPYAQWLERLSAHLLAHEPLPACLTAADLPPELAAQWADWWPMHALWLPGAGGGVLFVREAAWSEDEITVLTEWMGAWSAHFTSRHRAASVSVRSIRERLAGGWAHRAGQPWWRQPRWRWALALAAVLALPVRLAVLAPGELVPARPAVVRSPLDGVIEQFQVTPNQTVRAGEPLFKFDEALIRSRLEVAQQALATAQTDYRQSLQMALSDPKARSQLAPLMGKIEERRAEVALVTEQLTRSRVSAPQEGVVLMDDASEWIGKPVSVGERILRIAALDDREVEVWLPLADAIVLAPGAEVTLYLNANPLSPLRAQLRYMAHDAQPRPDGQFAYRVRATLVEDTDHRVGLKGTAKLNGGWVPLGYWMVRRPWAALRGYLGV